MNDDKNIMERVAQSEATISVVMLLRGRHLRELLDSVLNQTLLPTEVIVVDKSADAAPSENADFPFAVKIICCPSDRSNAFARNLGWQAASGTFIAFFDDNSHWRPEKLARQAAWLVAHPETALVHTGCTALVNGKEVDYVDKPARLSARDMINASHVLIGSILVRKDVLSHAGGFNEKFQTAEGFEYAFRLVDQDYILDFLAEPLLYMIRDRPEEAEYDWWVYFANHAAVVWHYRRHYSERIGTFGPWQHMMKHLTNAGHKQHGMKGWLLRFVAKLLWPLRVSS